MPGRLRACGSYSRTPLDGEWALASCEPGAVGGIEALRDAELTWIPCAGAMTAAAALRAHGSWSLDGPSRRFDAEDWWYRARFHEDLPQKPDEAWLCFDGLATIADIWLNGTLLFSAQGMFTAHECRVDALLLEENELVMRFHSLDAALKAKRPRPRWRVPMLEEQQLRWHRTTLLGRTPGWSPPAAPVGPWREIRLERRYGFSVDDVQLVAHGDGALDIGLAMRSIGTEGVQSALLSVHMGEEFHEFPVAITADGVLRWQRVHIPNAAVWFPHTHGAPAMYQVDALITTTEGREFLLVLGDVGFRTIEVRRDAGDFEVVVNGISVFCRGACWTPLDVVSLHASFSALYEAVQQLRDAGMNMVRVGGMMAYESDDFFDCCDRLGVLVWQDLMFANMDYPHEDAAFLASVTTESRQQLKRLGGRPSVAVICGNGEGEQQAAMWGASREKWTSPLFHEHLPDLVEEILPGAVYWPSSTHGGDFPHQANVGTTSYFGVGAYLRPLEDARRAEVRFATECLAFANIPEAAGMAEMPAGVAVRDATWRERSPRDRGASWDFDDVRDHYFSQIFDAEPAALCAANEARYLELSREVPGEVMARTFGEWRRKRSITRGALIWFWRDIWPGAGWGVLDAAGRPKAAWYHLRRACSLIALHISDEGGNGLGLHVANDTPYTLGCRLEIALWRADGVNVGRGALDVILPGHERIEVNAAALLDGFYDLSYAYRFGAPPQDLVSVRLLGPDDALVATAFHVIGRLPVARDAELGLTASATRATDGRWTLTISARRFAQYVRCEVEGFLCADNHFHLAPGEERRIPLAPLDAKGPPPTVVGEVTALNALAAVPIVVA